MNIPLAERMRPTRLDDVVGQTHLIGEGKILTNILKTGKIPNMIFYGPSGTGKTTVANICANAANRAFFKLNATTASLKDVRDIATKSTVTPAEFCFISTKFKILIKNSSSRFWNISKTAKSR